MNFSSDSSESESSTVPRDERDFLTNPYWIEDPDLKKGEVDFLSSAETQFWKDLIDKYLYPIDQDKDEQVSWNLIKLMVQAQLRWVKLIVLGFFHFPFFLFPDNTQV